MANRIAGCFQHAFGTFFVAATIALAGCASDIMKNYIGQPVESVILDYGPPTTVIDLDQGERAYQWQKISTNVVSGSTSGEVRNTRHDRRYEETETQRQECFYTFYAAPPPAAGTSPISVSQSWSVSSPRLIGAVLYGNP